MVIFGGKDANGGLLWDIWEYNITNDAWAQKPNSLVTTDTSATMLYTTDNIVKALFFCAEYGNNSLVTKDNSILEYIASVPKKMISTDSIQSTIKMVSYNTLTDILKHILSGGLNLPTTDPGIEGMLWNSLGVVKVSGSSSTFG